MAVTPSGIRALLPSLTAAGLLATLGLLQLVAVRHDCVTVDEFGHLPAGISYWRSGRFRLYRQNPPLIKLLCALPVLPLGPRLGPSAAGMTWWQAGRSFMEANAGTYFEWFFLARRVSIALSLLGGWLVFRWARELFGAASGLIALTLWCSSPYVLGHGRLVTPDVGAAVFGLAACYVFRGYLRAPGWRRAAAAGTLLGLAELSKFTLLVLYPAWLIVASVAMLSRRGRAPVGVWASAGHALLIVGLSILVINSGYGFEGSFRPLGRYDFSTPALRMAPPSDEDPDPWGNRFRGMLIGSIPAPLPAEYVRGLDDQNAEFDGRYPIYLNGEWRRRGWRYYYLVALAVKIPLGCWTLGLLALTLAVSSAGYSAPLDEEAALLVPAVAVLGLLSLRPEVAHSRYAIPLLPYAFVSLSRVGRAVALGHKRVTAVVGACLLWAAASPLSHYPHALSYFNELAGGPEGGRRLLSDSEIDWGQDLFALKQWLDGQHHAGPIGLAYFGHIDPSLIGVSYRLPAWTPQPGLYAVSVSLLQGMPWVARDGRGGFQPLRLNALAYFRHFKPTASAGDSILIYRVTAAEAGRVRRLLGLPPLGESMKARPE